MMITESEYMLYTRSIYFFTNIRTHITQVWWEHQVVGKVVGEGTRQQGIRGWHMKRAGRSHTIILIWLLLSVRYSVV